MSRQTPFFVVIIAASLVVLQGCQPQNPFYLTKKGQEDSHYLGMATQIEVPDLEAERLADADQAIRPISLQNKDTGNIWELSLEEAIKIALTNNKIMRNIGGQVQGPPDFILRNPELAPTIYGPALAESNPRTGPEAALSAFDAQLSTSVLWNFTDAPQNAGNFVSGIFPNVSEHDLGTFQAKLQKTAASGGTFSLAHNIAYDRDRFDYGTTQRLLYSSDWNVNLTAEMRQPLLQGAGTQFNRIAGPGATPGLYNGVVLARINTDIALADFEASVRNLVSDVEIAYWELYYEYRSLNAVVAGRDSALATWRKVFTLYNGGHDSAKGGEAEKLAQAGEQYFLFRSTAERSLNELYVTEAKLRYLMGLAATDGRLIRPKEEPTTAKISFDWADMLNEGLARSVELRQQKWIVKRRELELIASKNFLMPKLDAVAQYRWLGFGNRLDGNGDLNLDNVPSPVPDSNAYRMMTGGQYQEWQMGVQGSLPLGFRREMAGVRNAELQLTQERAKLQEGELELSHQLAYALRDLEANYVLTQTNFNRRIAAQRQVEAVATAYEQGTITIDVLLQAQQALAQAESEYYRSLVNYNKSITQIHYRKGSLLEYNGVYLAEGPWPGKAYFDARRRARARDASTYLDYGFTQPRVVSRGPLEQQTGEGVPYEGDESGDTPASAPKNTELIPKPEPETMQPSAEPTPPPAPEPLAEPRASASGSRDSTAGSTASGWKTAKTVDRQVAAAGWTVPEKNGNHESGTNPPTAGVDRSASGWKGIQR
jgi:outer membrane protein TolC